MLNMLKEIFDHIPQFSLSKKNAVLDCDLNCTNSGRDTETKTSPRHKYTTYAHNNQKFWHSLRPSLPFFPSPQGGHERKKHFG